MTKMTKQSISISSTSMAAANRPDLHRDCSPTHINCSFFCPKCWTWCCLYCVSRYSEHNCVDIFDQKTTRVGRG